MRSAPFQLSAEMFQSPTWRRTRGLVLTILAHILLLILLLNLAPKQIKLPGTISRLLTFNVTPEAKNDNPRIQATASSSQARRAAKVPPPTAVPPPIIKMPAAPWVLTPGLERFDVKQVPVTKPAETAPDADDTTAGDSAYTGGAGAGTYGPRADGSTGGGGGERLFYAEWYREPTNAELSFYLPKDLHEPGYGEVACRTVERFHVEDCRQLGESPPGSGYARAVRQAAWQFLVKPPHLGGRTLVGEWVRIRITYTEGGAEIDRSRRRR